MDVPWDVIVHLDLLEAAEIDDTLVLADGGGRVPVSSLARVLFPETGHTKGDLLRYYAAVSPVLLPLLDARPLVLHRLPEGVGGTAFFQHRAPARVPDGVRVERVAIAGHPPAPRLVAGSLATLLWTVQLGAITVHPWHSRVTALADADWMVLDLDPGPRARFPRVVETALRVRDALGDEGGTACVKTSGATGLHVYVPLPAGTRATAALARAEALAKRVAAAAPRLATVERAVRARPADAVYVDALQNVVGKSVASAFAARARRRPTVSTPLAWEELVPGLDPRDFTIDGIPDEAEARAAHWAPVAEAAAAAAG